MSTTHGITKSTVLHLRQRLQKQPPELIPLQPRVSSPLIYALVSNLADQRIRSVRGGQQTASAREKVTREQ